MCWVFYVLHKLIMISIVQHLLYNPNLNHGHKIDRTDVFVAKMSILHREVRVTLSSYCYFHSKGVIKQIRMRLVRSHFWVLLGMSQLERLHFLSGLATLLVPPE